MAKLRKLGWLIAGATAAWAGGSYYAVQTVFSHMYAKWVPEKYTWKLRYSEIIEKYPGKYDRRPVNFYSGNNRLQGYIYNEKSEKGMIVFSHGIFSCHEDYIGVILGLVDRGWCVFAFDNTGTGESEGEDGRGLVQGPLDLHAALCYIESTPGLAERKRFLVGHSQGGYSVGAVLNFEHRIDGVVSISGFSTPYEVTTELGETMYGDVVKITFPMIALEYKKRFGEYAELSSIDGINAYEGPVLVMHGVEDDYVSYKGSAIINHSYEIMNPRISYSHLSWPGRSGHVSIFSNEEGAAMVKEIEAKLEALRKEYKVGDNRDIPEEKLIEVYADVDKWKASAGNEELYDEINDWLENL